MGVFLSADLFTTFIFFEIMSFTSYTWVAHDETPGAMRAAETYLAVAIIGGMVMLMGLFLLWNAVGTLTISELYEAAKACPRKGTNLGGEHLHPLRLRREGGHVPAAHLAAEGAPGCARAGLRAALRHPHQVRHFRRDRRFGEHLPREHGVGQHASSCSA